MVLVDLGRRYTSLMPSTQLYTDTMSSLMHSFSIIDFIAIGISVVLLCTLVLVIRHSKRKERELSDLKMEFVATASHEMRSPLTAVRWTLSELRNSPTLSQDARTIVNDLYERISALIARSSTFLETAASDYTHMQRKDLKNMDLSVTLREVIIQAQSIAQMKHTSVRVDPSFDGVTPVLGDPARLRLVFDNLLSNAVKYSPDHSVIRVSCTQDRYYKRIAIQDQGIGIPKSEIKAVFTGYHRASNAQRSGALGSGFGLFMAKKIVDFHGGTLTCESEEGKGTTFIVSLPSGV